MPASETETVLRQRCDHGSSFFPGKQLIVHEACLQAATFLPSGWRSQMRQGHYCQVDFVVGRRNPAPMTKACGKKQYTCTA